MDRPRNSRSAHGVVPGAIHDRDALKRHLVDGTQRNRSIQPAEELQNTQFYHGTVLPGGREANMMQTVCTKDSLRSLMAVRLNCVKSLVHLRCLIPALLMIMVMLLAGLIDAET